MNSIWQATVPRLIECEMTARWLRPTGATKKRRGLLFYMAEGGKGLAHDAKNGCYVMYDSIHEGCSDPAFFGYSEDVLG